MPDTLSTITNLINSPPGVLVAGGVLAGIIWKFFERVEAVLNEDTKTEIWAWLADRRPLSSTFQRWPDTFAQVFDRLFGKKHLSWKCFWRSCVTSLVVVTVATVFVIHDRFGSDNGLAILYDADLTDSVRYLPFFIWFNLLPDYLSLLETRFVLGVMKTARSSVLIILLLVFDLGLTAMTGYTATIVAYFSTKTELAGPLLDHQLTVWRQLLSLWKQEIAIHSEITSHLWTSIVYLGHHPRPVLFGINNFTVLWYYPAFFTSVWLWLYAASGFLLKGARRFDIGFQWFNRRFDIEKKPLSSIGLVAGALVALVYWAAVIVSRFA